jgi:Malonate decarboxylase, alpha subunit, transporter/Phosphoribosyl-dephospho-CoA transferase MdcG
VDKRLRTPNDLQILIAMMVIRGVYERHEVRSLNHGIGFDTAAIELLLPTYAESLGLRGKICEHWALNPHPTLIPVARRAISPKDRIAVGVRGQERQQRWGGFMRKDQIVKVIAPWPLRSGLANTVRLSLPAMQSLRFLEIELASLSNDWGPGGSVGYELASRAPVVTRESDNRQGAVNEGRSGRQSRGCHGCKPRQRRIED